MPRFQFRLQRILKLSEHIERGYALEVGLARNELERREKDLQEVIRVREMGRDHLLTHGSGVDVGRFALFHSVLDQLQQTADEVEKARMIAERALDGAIERHVEARQNRETLSRLRARAYQQWLTEELRMEQKEMDEVARRMRIQRR